MARISSSRMGSLRLDDFLRGMALELRREYDFRSLLDSLGRFLSDLFRTGATGRLPVDLKALRESAFSWKL